MDIRLPVSEAILDEVAKLDRFQAAWSGRHPIPSRRLARIREAAVVQSVGSSCRLAGIRLSDAEVSEILEGRQNPPDAGQVRGYAAALAQPLPDMARLVDMADVGRLHALMLGLDDDKVGLLRKEPLHRESFDAEGRATGRVLTTLPPRLIETTFDQSMTWLEYELRSGEHHPVLVIGGFLLYFLAISPYPRGNGRIARLLAGHLLVRSGYTYIPYASLEREIEERREAYHLAMDRAQTRLWTDEVNIEPWLQFFLEVLGEHRDRVEDKARLEQRAQDFPPLQRAILEAVREHGTVDAGLLLSATGANRNTLKDNLRRLVDRGVLERTGVRRGTRYRMATERMSEVAGPAYGR